MENQWAAAEPVHGLAGIDNHLAQRQLKSDEAEDFSPRNAVEFTGTVRPVIQKTGTGQFLTAKGWLQRGFFGEI